MEEKPIKDFPGYTVTSDGKVISYKFSKPRVMKTWIQLGGYENIKLCRENKTYHFLIHRLVAEAFIPNPEGLPEINHKNKIRNDNRAENLEWCSRLDNLYDSYSTMSSTRNFKRCNLIDPKGEIVKSFLTKLDASRYASSMYGCSITGMQKNGKSRGFTLQEV